MTAPTTGLVSVSIIAGHLTATSQPVHPVIGQQFVMGNGTDLIIHITPATARQWIQALGTIADKEA